MEAKRMVKWFFSFIGIIALAFTMSCQHTREMTGTAGDSKISEEAKAGSQTAALLDERISSFNEEIAMVEREVMASESVSEEGFREGWREIEVKRHELNRNIDAYNNAVENEATLEASEIRSDINRLLGELQTDLREFRSEYGSDAGQMETEMNQEGFEFQEEDSEIESEEEMMWDQKYEEDEITNPEK